MTNPIDNFDENEHFEIGDAMRRIAGGTPGVDDAFTGFRRRVRRARMQRAAATVGGVAAVAALALGIPALVNAGGSDNAPAQSGGITLATDTTVDDSGIDTDPAGSSGGTGTPSGGSGSSNPSGASGSSNGPGAGGSASGVRGASGDSGSGSSDDPGDNPGHDSGDDSGPAGSSGSSGAVLPDLTKTCTSSGGSVTARRLRGVVSITAATPAAGFVEHEREVESDRAKVEFRSGELEYQLIVRFGTSTATCLVES